MNDLNDRLEQAVRHFWLTRTRQAKQQGVKTGRKDAGTRGAVTGGRQLDGFVALCREMLIESGLPDGSVYWRLRLELPGYFRPEKKWDLIAVVAGQTIAVIEFKSQVGSFGNNCNNRAEESVGNATDLWAAYREGAFKPSQRPWLGYMVLLEDAPASTRPVRVKEPHYRVFEEFRGASYAKRYELLLLRLLRERLYDGACLLMSSQAKGIKGQFSEPCEELTFRNFASSFMGHAAAFAKTHLA
jgi:hypothetical protein